MKRLALTGVSCICVLGVLVGWQTVKADGRILPNVSVGGISVAGLTPDEARIRLTNALRTMNLTGLIFTYRDRTVTILANEPEAETDRPPVVQYDIDGMVNSAFAFGHDGGLATLTAANLRALVTEVILPTQVEADTVAMRKLLVERFTAVERPKHDAELRITKVHTGASSTPEWSIEILRETAGVSFDYDVAIGSAVERLPRWQGSVTELTLREDQPLVTAEKVDGLRPKIEEILDRGGVALAYDDLTWPIDSDTLASALTVKPGRDGAVRIGLKPSFIDPLLKKAEEAIETDPAPTRLTVVDGRATEFQGGRLGKYVNRESTFAAVDEFIDRTGAELIPIVVDTVPSSDSDPLAEELGIREMLGYGTSSFKGSPKNRRKNIANGARLLDGLMFKPGEEIGLLEHLRPFTAANGYLPELVIKGSRTVPEYGGGLCQIGTTTFRATMGAGLPITQRQNHSYRVVYYEPAGTDATLYDPAPDFKFVNDTGYNILLVAREVPGKDLLRFEFWGTRDGRVQQQSKVLLWDVKAPPPAKLIETDALPEGKKKCFESPHAGAKTSFTYTITYPDGRVEKKDFKSVYKPWQEQCLIGKPGAPRISFDKDGSLIELPPLPPAPVVAGATSTTQ